jgi:hypothetical protein
LGEFDIFEGKRDSLWLGKVNFEEVQKPEAHFLADNKLPVETIATSLTGDATQILFSGPQ